jgi:C_GCAxxG_C_C family probable redox protein
MTPDEARQRAIELFKQRFHCSQAVAAAGQEFMDMDEPAVIRAMGAFGGGIASQGSVCGCLTGGIAVISQLHSRANLEETETPEMWKGSYKLLKLFKELTEDCGGINCRDVARVDWRNKDEVKQFYRDPNSRRQRCIKLVGDTAYALAEMLEAEKSKE